MAKSKSNSENILVKVDQNNLMYIDPNSTISSDGTISPRGVEHEKLVMYANLEADIIPRTTFYSAGNQNTMTSIAKGTFSFLGNGSDFTSGWTDAFLTKDDANKDINKNPSGQVQSTNDVTGQSFGIDSINIQVRGTNFVPQVNITFIDVRGKTLFSAPEDSPYKAFFHVPWPIFYLTIKGYYGKAIKYRLHLVKFSTKFNDSNGNFEVSTTFVGSTYAYLNDIPLKGIMNAPYMYAIENATQAKFNEKKGEYTQTISKSSKGYQMLKSVYAEYKRKKLIPQNFPVKTLREVCAVAQSLDKILEQQIYDQVVNMKVFSAIKDFEETVTTFEKEVKAWGKIRLIDDVVKIGDVDYYYQSNKDKSSTEFILGDKSVSTLEKILENGKKKLKESELFNNAVLNDKTNKTKSSFNREKIVSQNLGVIKDYYTEYGSSKFVVIAFDKLVNQIYGIIQKFNEQKERLQNEVEKQMNEIVKDSTRGGVGFEPTIRNLFAVILANADVYIRLLKDVHKRAIDVSDERKKIIKNFSSDSIGDDIYPWPEIKKSASEDKQKIIAYPGEQDLELKLKSSDPILWPEVEFIEKFIRVTSNREDTTTQTEGGVNKVSYVFEGDLDTSKIKTISPLEIVSKNVPYVEKSQSGFLYEIWERAYNFMLLESYKNDTIKELAELEFDNIKESIKEDDDLLGILFNNVKNEVELRTLLQSLSPFERYTYYKDQLATTPYISNVLTDSFKIEQYTSLSDIKVDNGVYNKLNNELLNYTPESYRKNIYPFNSSTYLSYLNKDKFTDDNFKFGGVLQVNTKDGLLTGPISPNYWVRTEEGKTNIFSQKLTITGTTTENILNTPYFHNQLYSDFGKSGSAHGRYAGSAYLLLNSLPFVELQDYVNFKNGDYEKSVLVSSLFREVGSTQFVPYHLVLKWGSIYHRYKKQLLEGDDILSGCSTNNITKNINTSEFFNSGNTQSNFTGFTFSGGTVVSGNTSKTDVGVHPYYDTIFHQIINDYNHYNPLSGNTSFSGYTNTGGIVGRKRTQPNNINYWTQYVDNSKYPDKIQTYTTLPCDGDNEFIGKKILTSNPVNARLLGVLPNISYQSTATYEQEEQKYFRPLWIDSHLDDDFSGKTIASYSEYNKTISDIYSLSEVKRKIIDLIATFSPKILDEFETMFLNFASEKVNVEINSRSFSKVSYYQFQDILKEIFTVRKEDSDSSKTVDEVIDLIKERQTEKLLLATSNILSNESLIKITIGNPKEIDPHVFDGFSRISQDNTFSYKQYESSQLTTDNQDYIKLYIGEDIDGYYQQFFSSLNVELSENNILQFRPLILIYAGYRKNGGTNTLSAFQTYLKTNIYERGPSENEASGFGYRFSLFLNILTSKFRTLKTQSKNKKTKIDYGYNNKDLKIELYNTFKSFNDKWIAGNSIGQRLLLEEFLFLDKANKDIGDQYYLNLTKFIDIADPKNNKSNLYGIISDLLNGTGFDMRALPAYVNFYGTNFSSKTKITPSKKVADNIFGTFLDVDYQESSPKIIIQYVSGPVSKHPAIENKKYKFADDSFNISNVNNNPLIITLPKVFTDEDLSKSNKVVAFEVSFGDQNQSIFKGVQLDQSTLRNTSESFVVLENLARSESGSGVHNVDVSLFDYYRQASYSCEVTMMGNVMIQPTMFFYLKNIPIFKGSYWITEVSHNIKGNNIVTTFKGTRIPYASLPNPKDSFMSNYRALFDKIMNTAVARTKEIDKQTKTTKTISTPEGNFRYDPGTITIPGEKVVPSAGVTKYGVPYNGYNNELYIQKVTYNGLEWFRAVVVKMGMDKIYEISDDTTMSLFNKINSKKYTLNPKSVKWSAIKNSDMKFYSTKFQVSPSIPADKIIDAPTQFLNPKNPSKPYTLIPNYQLDTTIGTLKVNGPINEGPNLEGYGIAMSSELMNILGLYNGDVVYFWVGER
jgi:hypothetical protein